MSVFTGPIFASDNPEYRGVRVPRTFWKILVRVEPSGLRATAFRASQEALLLEELEAFGDLGRVAVFQSRVDTIAAETNLDFGALVDADSQQTEAAGERELQSLEQVEWQALQATPDSGSRRYAI